MKRIITGFFAASSIVKLTTILRKIKLTPSFICLIFLVPNFAFAGVIWGDVTSNPDGAVETVTKFGNTINVATEAAAINTSTGIANATDIAAVIRGLLTGNTIEALAGVGGILNSITTKQSSATALTNFLSTVQTDDNSILKSVSFVVEGAFITQRKEGIIFTDISQANIEGAITFGGETAAVQFNPAEAIGTTETPTAKMFSGTATINLDQQIKQSLFSFSSTMNAFEAGGPFDSFSAAIMTRWEATVTTMAMPVSEPASLVLLGLGLAGLGRKLLNLREK